MKKKLNFDYAMMQGTYWMFYTVAAIFVSVYMLGKGYSNTTIGLVIAVGNIASIALQGIIANITDKVDRITNITVIKMLIAALFVLTSLVLLIGQKSLFLTIMYTCLIVAHTVMHPFVNSLSFTLEESGEHVSFGIGRSVGSFSAGALGMLMGYIVEDFGVDSIPIIGLLVLALMTVFIIFTGRHYRQACRPLFHYSEKNRSNTDETISRPISMIDFIKRNKLFIVLSVGTVALFFGNVVLENFTIQIVEGIGGNTEQMGTVIFVMCLLEMPAMICFDKLREKFSFTFLLRVGAIFFTMKIVMIYFANSMLIMYLAQLNQLIGYGILFPGLVGFIDYIMDKGEAIRGQAVFTAAITIGNVLGSVFGGMILDAATPKMLLLISSVISICGTTIICMLASRIKPKKMPA